MQIMIKSEEITQKQPPKTFRNIKNIGPKLILKKYLFRLSLILDLKIYFNYYFLTYCE